MGHLLGGLGVLAAGVLLAVSAAMNWQFGFQLGRTPFDGMIYGSASVAADCMKALVPFFFFAALRNKMWSQAAASAVLWSVVTAYSLTSALGHAALNRYDTAGGRAVEAQTYKDLRADLVRAQGELSWNPQHRPAAAVQADIDNAKIQRPWAWTKGCTDVSGKQGREFCQQYNGWLAELASANNSARLEARVAEISSKLSHSNGASSSAEADPQAAVLAQLTGLDKGQVQTAMMIFVALLLEIGSGFGMYVAFSQWRLYDREAPSAPKMAAMASTHTAVAAVAVQPVATPAPVQIAKPRSGANDNKTAPQPQRLVAPETDVERFYKEKVDTQDGSSLTATALYEEYCAWCEEQSKEPLALPTFGREFGDLGVQKAKVAGRVRYIGISLKSELDAAEDKKPTVFKVEAA